MTLIKSTAAAAILVAFAFTVYCSKLVQCTAYAGC